MAVDVVSPDGEMNESTTAGCTLDPSSADSSSESTRAATGAEVAAAATEDTASEGDYPTGADDEADGIEPAKNRESRRSTLPQLRLVVAVGLVVVLALGGLAGWLAFRAYESHQTDEQRQLFLQVGRQGAINLTTLDWQNADADVQRILDAATGTFYDDFSQRSQPFVEVLKKTQSTTEGTITDAGLESLSGDEAQVLVAVKVKTSTMAEPEQHPRFWRMRLSVTKVGDDESKVSNVAFIP